MNFLKFILTLIGGFVGSVILSFIVLFFFGIFCELFHYYGTPKYSAQLVIHFLSFSFFYGWMIKNSYSFFFK